MNTKAFRIHRALATLLMGAVREQLQKLE